MNALLASMSPPVGATAPASRGGLYRNIWRHAAGARPQLLFSAALLVASQLVKLCVPWLAAQAINALQQNGPQALPRAAGFIGLVMLTFVVAWALHGPGRVLERSVGIRIRRSHADALYAKLMRLPMAWHDRHHSSDVQQRIGQSTGALYGFAQSQFVYLQSAVNLFGPLLALCLFSGKLGAMALVGYVVVGSLILRFDRTLMRLATEENAAERHYQAGVMDFLGNVATVFSLRLQQSSRRLLGERLSQAVVPLKRSIAMNEIKWCAVDLFTVALTWGLVAAFVGLSSGALLIGSVFMVYQYAQQASGVIGSIAGNFQGLARTRTDFASAAPIWAAADQPIAGTAVAPDWQRLQIRDLCHAHTPAAAPAPGPDHGSTAEAEADAKAPAGLHHVTLTLERGDRVALVGPSGSGKSTLMRVLAGLYVPHQGSIEVDGVAQLGTRHLGSIATLIPQEADVFESTVRENIAFDSAASDADVLDAVHASAFDAVACDLPDGLATRITERGANLSGGQRQRLCLARGLLAARDSSLLMLDEPTSALDPVTEEAVFHRISTLFGDACVIASVHRMSLLHHFNKVVLMVDGRVLDVGTADELSARQPMFREMTARRPERAGIELVDRKLAA